MGAMARVYLARARRPAALAGWTPAGDLLDRARRRHPAQGSGDRDVRRAHRRDAWRSLDRSLRGCGAAAARRHCSGSACWCCPGSSPSSAGPAASFFAESVGQDLIEQGDQRAGGAWRAAGLLFRAVLGDVLAGRDAGRHGDAGVWAARREKGAQASCWPGSCRPGSCSNWWSTKLPHYVLPLYPAIAILIAGVIDPHVLSRQTLAGSRHRLVVLACR